ncbi:hypothetical protein D3C72_2001830 [compost metagenome]
MVLISSAFITDVPSPLSTLILVEPAPFPIPGRLSWVLSIGRSFTTYIGWLFPFREPFPRITTLVDPLGPVAVLLTFTPAILPTKAFAILVSLAFVNSVPLSSVTA